MPDNKPYEYMSADEIARFIVETEEAKEPLFDIREGFRVSCLTIGGKKIHRSKLEKYEGKRFYRLACDFYHSLDDNSPAATKFKKQLSLLTDFYFAIFYARYDTSTAIITFLDYSIKMIISEQLRYRFMRGMYRAIPYHASDMERILIARAVANSPFAQCYDVCTLLRDYYKSQLLMNSAELELFMQLMEKLATKEILAELRKDVPHTPTIEDIIRAVSSTCDQVPSNEPEYKLACEIKKKISIDNMINLAKANAANEPVEKPADSKDKEIAALANVAQDAMRDGDRLLNEVVTLRKQMADIQSQLGRANAHLKVGIGSRGVNNMKRVINDICAKIK